MKTSNKILVTTGITIAIIIFASVLGSRVLLSRYTNNSEEGNTGGSSLGMHYENFKDFNRIDISGNWDIVINQAKDFSILVLTPEINDDQYEIKLKKDILVLKQKEKYKSDMKFTVKITMPELLAVNSSGGAKITLEGFNSKYLHLNLEGGAWVSGSNCEFENFFVNSSGALNLTFEKIETVNADVQISGAGNLVLNMAGGVLSGDVSRAVNVEYYGDARQKISASGLSNIRHRD